MLSRECILNFKLGFSTIVFVIKLFAQNWFILSISFHLYGLNRARVCFAVISNAITVSKTKTTTTRTRRVQYNYCLCYDVFRFETRTDRFDSTALISRLKPPDTLFYTEHRTAIGCGRFEHYKTLYYRFDHVTAMYYLCTPYKCVCVQCTHYTVRVVFHSYSGTKKKKSKKPSAQSNSRHVGTSLFGTTVNSRNTT